jgi:hypothetical protein
MKTYKVTLYKIQVFPEFGRAQEVNEIVVDADNMKDAVTNGIHCLLAHSEMIPGDNC